MSLATCSGQPGFPKCSDCARLRPNGIMHPVVKLTNCAFFEASARAKAARSSLGKPATRKPKPKLAPRLAPYAGAPT